MDDYSCELRRYVGTGDTETVTRYVQVFKRVCASLIDVQKLAASSSPDGAGLFAQLAVACTTLIAVAP